MFNLQHPCAKVAKSARSSSGGPKGRIFSWENFLRVVFSFQAHLFWDVDVCVSFFWGGTFASIFELMNVYDMFVVYDCLSVYDCFILFF